MLPQIPLLNQNYKPLLTITLKKQEPKPTEQLYTIKDKDTLTSISEATGSSVERLWAKNPSLTDPNIINPGGSLTIPQKDEALEDRAMPIPVLVQPTILEKPVSDISHYTRNPSGAVSTPSRGGTKASGNFEYGWCTYYADQQRPDIHATGNASDWIRYANSKVPKVGAVAVNTWAAGGLGHVGIVLEINGDKILVRSMNYQRFGDVTDDWTDAKYWAGYIL